MRVTQLNHIGLHVNDLAASRTFYGEVLGLREIARPDMGFPGAWFGVGADQEVHLIARAPKEGAYTPPRERHVAFAVSDMEEVKQALSDRGMALPPVKQRPDGALQLFLRDPDDHVIELCELKKPTP